MCSTLPKNLATTTLPPIAGNDSTTFPASRLRTSSRMFDHFFKVPSSFCGGDPDETGHLPPQMLVIISTIVEMVLEKAEVLILL